MATHAERVALAWASGASVRTGTLTTDGQTVYSYDHTIGVTNSDGTKIALVCRFSNTTARHCSELRVVTGVHLPCPQDHSGIVKKNSGR